MEDKRLRGEPVRFLDGSIYYIPTLPLDPPEGLLKALEEFKHARGLDAREELRVLRNLVYQAVRLQYPAVVEGALQADLEVAHAVAAQLQGANLSKKK